MPKRDDVRLNLVVSARVKARIERLQERLGEVSMTEVIRRSLELHESLFSLEDSGSRLAAVDRNGDLTFLVIV